MRSIDYLITLLMDFFRYSVILFTLLVSLIFAQSAFADELKLTKNPEYIDVTQALNSLVTAKNTQAQSENYNLEQVSKQIDELEFQKYTLETGISWGQCRNETGNVLAVYGPKSDDNDYPYENAVYFLANGQTTQNKWDCDGFYLPNDATIAPSSTTEDQIVGPVAIKVSNGNQLVVKTNFEKDLIELNISPVKVLKPGDANWFIPNVTRAVINARVANAPTVNKTESSNSDKSKVVIILKIVS